MIRDVKELRKPLVSLDINQHSAQEIFAVKKSAISEISKESLYYIFTEFDRNN